MFLIVFFFNYHANEISFSYERMSTKTQFENEAKGNSNLFCVLNEAKMSFIQCCEKNPTSEIMTTSQFYAFFVKMERNSKVVSV